MDENKERRLVENAVGRLLYGKVQGIEKIVLDVQHEVKITNGRVTAVEGKLGEHEGKFEALEIIESFQKGVRKGKLSVRTSARNNILLFIAIAGLILAATAYGTKQIRHWRSVEIAELKQRASRAEDYYRHENPKAEGLPWNNH